MDLHPSGVPRLVGPAGGGGGGGGSPSSDFSTQFRFLPNNLPPDLSSSPLDSLSLRSHAFPPPLQLLSTSPRGGPSSPLRIPDCEDYHHPKAAAAPSRGGPRLLPSTDRPRLGLPANASFEPAVDPEGKPGGGYSPPSSPPYGMILLQEDSVVLPPGFGVLDLIENVGAAEIST